MAVNTLPRDYDIARIIDDYQRRISFLERLVLNSPVAASIWQNAPGGFDTGWQNITDFEPGNSAQAGTNTPQVRRYGPVVMARGRGNTGSPPFATLPSGFGFEPLAIWELGHGTTSPSSTSRFIVSPNGEFSAQGWTAGATLAFSSTWGVSLP